MGKIVENDQPCPLPGCGSSDGVQVYEAGDAFCFSCKKRIGNYAAAAGGVTERPAAPKKQFVASGGATRNSLEEIQTYPVLPIKSRHISREVCDFFGVRVSKDADGAIDCHYYPYEGDTNYKIRRVADKKFFWAVSGKPSKDLFGRDRFNSGGKRVIVVEGEIDVLSVAEALRMRYDGKIYPVVGLSSGVMTDSLLLHRDWLRSFEEVVLFMDQDKVGEEALSKALKIVGADKAKIVKTSQYKDANEVLDKADHKTLMQLIFDASKYIPSGMITKDEVWKRIVERQNRVAIPYPPCARGLNLKLKGMRGGEITLLISGTGSGKSTLVKEIGLHLVSFQPLLQAIIDDMNSRLEEGQEPLKPFHIKVGMVSLEEPPEETGEKLAAMYLNKNLEEEHVPLSELKAGFDAVFDDDNIMLLDHQGSMGDASIIEKLEYMILSGCTHLFIDHITILVSEGAEGLTGNEAIDKVMNDLLRLVTRYPHVWIGLVSHLRKTSTGKPFEAGQMPSIDDIKGSGSIKQVSFDIVAFCRDMTALDELDQNHIMMAVLKCRRTGRTGNVPGSRYIRQTGRLQYIEDANDGFTAEAFETVIEAKAVDVTPPTSAPARLAAPTPSLAAPKSPTLSPSPRPTLKVPAPASKDHEGF